MKDHLEQEVAEFFLEVLGFARLLQDIDSAEHLCRFLYAGRLQALMRLTRSQGHPSGPRSFATISQSRPTSSHGFFSSANLRILSHVPSSHVAEQPACHGFFSLSSSTSLAGKMILVMP